MLNWDLKEIPFMNSRSSQRGEMSPWNASGISPGASDDGPSSQPPM